MQKNILLLLLFLGLGGAAFYLYNTKKDVKSSSLAPDMDFTVRDTASVTKIFLANRNGTTILLERQKENWILNGKGSARQSAVTMLLNCLSKQQVKYVPPASANRTMIAGLSTFGIKTEIYLNGSSKPAKVFYVGDVTPDEIGTHMIMEGSEQPYVVHIPSFVGALRERYMMNPDEWKDRRIFAENLETIQTVGVEYPFQKANSFLTERTKDGFVVKPFYATQQTFPAAKARRGLAESYVNQYRQINSEGLDSYRANRDSISRLVPFCVVTITKTDGTQKQARFHSAETQIDTKTGQPVTFRYYVNGSWGEFYLAQHNVLGPIFRGYDYFFDVAPQGNGRILN
jgi:hypothetical protein